MRALALLLCLLPGLAPGLAWAAASNVFTSPQATARIVSAGNTPGRVQLGLQFQLAPGWHIYWSYAGDAGFPPQLTSTATLSPLTFPPPALLTQGPITDYVLSGSILLPFTATGAPNPLQINAAWLVCADICIPQHANFTLPLTGGASPEAALFTPSPIVPSPFPASITPGGTLTITGPTAAQVAAARFFPFGPGMLANGAAQPLAFTATGLTLQLTLPPNPKPLAGLLELTDKSGAMQALTLTPAPATPPAHAPYLLLAFLGGLILNLMPCVFPILALKTFALARLGNAGAKIRLESFSYSAGVLLSMAALGAALLAARALGAAAGWGFQFQSPAFVALVALIFLAAALSLAGRLELATPAFLGRIPAQTSFATGILAVITATPCTAPFMGPALAAALIAPAFTAMGVFLALGLGLATPVLLLAAFPALARLIPRPGGWMLTLQRLLALPMLAAFAWLAWVLYRQTGLAGLGLLGLATALILATTLARRYRPAAFAALLILPFLHTAPSAAALTLPGAAPYSPARLSALRAANTPVFIDLTAAWCVTCLVNEATTLATPTIQSAFAARHVALLVGDWTNKSPAITALLAANHRAGVPLYLYYPPEAASPVTLPQILNEADILSLLRAAPQESAPPPAPGG
jgi:thiol:disulfide interchange protein DsbD